jgi:hypothetical protein
MTRDAENFNDDSRREYFTTRGALGEVGEGDEISSGSRVYNAWRTS